MKQSLLSLPLILISCSNPEQEKEETVKLKDSTPEILKSITTLPNIKNMDTALVLELNDIYYSDQGIRNEYEEMEKSGKDPMKNQEFMRRWFVTDSVNQTKVIKILDKQGWLGPEEVGQQANNTLFLVIQHADQKTQEKYLPMMREAVKKGNAQAANLALLEDRVLLGQGKKQIYGSQIGMDQVTKTYYVDALEDPENVDKRRAEVGLGPIAEYVSYWNMKWNVEEHKKFWADKEAKEKTKK